MIIAPIGVNDILITFTNHFMMVIALVTNIMIIVYISTGSSVHHSRSVKKEEGDHDCLEPVSSRQKQVITEMLYNRIQDNTSTGTLSSDANSALDLYSRYTKVILIIVNLRNGIQV